MDELLLLHELQALQNRYITTIDQDRLEEWPGLFIAEGRYEIVPRENVDLGLPAGLMHCFGQPMMRDRVVALRKANVFERQLYRHFVSGLRIVTGSGDRVETASNYMVVRTLSETDLSIFQVGVYEDIVVRTESGWRYAAKRAIFDNARVHTLLAIPV
jgi:anthranilate 1,2-dioxygenase small subunit